MTSRVADWRPMTPDEIDSARKLAHCRFPCASFSKRFARSLAEQATRAEPVITAKQAEALTRLLHTYRRQIAQMGPTP